MESVLQLTRTLEYRPVVVVPVGLNLRTYAGPTDDRAWLELRHQAFARQKVGVRQWNEADFAEEILRKQWFRPDWLWFAETLTQAGDGSRTIGTVCLAQRGHPPTARPVVHWLAVAPAFRRRGVGRMLLAALEQAAWDARWRQVWLETHRDWQAGVRFYRALGYHPADD